MTVDDESLEFELSSTTSRAENDDEDDDVGG
jgi:hypothetical protein